jgi:hypothetical protein
MITECQTCQVCRTSQWLMANNSNKKLSIWRKQCRDALVAHIRKSIFASIASHTHMAVDDRLHVEVDPALVRLQPSPEDQYAWSVTESKAFLLKSPLSTHSVKNLQLICREIGSSIEAIASTDGFQPRGEPGRQTRDVRSVIPSWRLITNYLRRLRSQANASIEMVPFLREYVTSSLQIASFVKSWTPCGLLLKRLPMKKKTWNLGLVTLKANWKELGLKTTL